MKEPKHGQKIYKIISSAKKIIKPSGRIAINNELFQLPRRTWENNKRKSRVKRKNCRNNVKSLIIEN